jgi:hypothetical protein
LVIPPLGWEQKDLKISLEAAAAGAKEEEE